MIRLIIGLRILRGPRGNRPLRTSPGNIKRRVLLGICCVLIASAATHSGAGRDANSMRSPLPARVSPSTPSTPPRSSLMRLKPRPTASRRHHRTQIAGLERDRRNRPHRDGSTGPTPLAANS
jgi:hypothetical protein